MTVAPSARNYLVVSQRLDELAETVTDALPTQSVRVALLGNATLDHLQSYLKVECYRAGLRPLVYQGRFDQYTQDILNPRSELYAFSPEVVICAIHASRLFPHIHHDPFTLTIEERRAEMDAGLTTMTTSPRRIDGAQPCPGARTYNGGASTSCDRYSRLAR